MHLVSSDILRIKISASVTFYGCRDRKELILEVKNGIRVFWLRRTSSFSPFFETGKKCNKRRFCVHLVTEVID